MCRAASKSVFISLQRLDMQQRESSCVYNRLCLRTTPPCHDGRTQLQSCPRLDCPGWPLKFIIQHTAVSLHGNKATRKSMTVQQNGFEKVRKEGGGWQSLDRWSWDTINKRIDQIRFVVDLAFAPCIHLITYIVIYATHRLLDWTLALSIKPQLPFSSCYYSRLPFNYICNGKRMTLYIASLQT